MNLIQTLEAEEIARLAKVIPEFAPGDTVIVSVNVVEGTRKRVQACTRLRVPSTTLTLTMTVSPGANSGITLARRAISSASRVWIKFMISSKRS